MNVLYLLLPLALCLGLIGLGLMIWAVKNGQFEDLEGPAQRILFEDDQALMPTQKLGLASEYERSHKTSRHEGRGDGEGKGVEWH